MPSRAATALTALLAAAALSGCGGAEDVADAPGGTWTAALEPTAAWADLDPQATGTADVSSTGSTSVHLAVAGLHPDTAYMAHVHDGACDEDPPGGGHWLADPDGEDATGNIIELSFTTDGTGTAAATDSTDLVPDDRAKSIVVHAPDDLATDEGADSNRVLCGDLKAE
ncbi:hypothetical protein [Glycomyces sp. NPDC047010]|uniref:hypothetical protein n=1 Tax=Glycomyces sp. NPDC047010 TaxID=3155023 RepID=UPI00340765E1